MLYVGAVRVHGEDFDVAGPVRAKDYCGSVAGPGGVEVPGRVVCQSFPIRAVRVHHVDFLVTVQFAREDYAATRRYRRRRGSRRRCRYNGGRGRRDCKWDRRGGRSLVGYRLGQQDAQDQGGVPPHPERGEVARTAVHAAPAHEGAGDRGVNLQGDYGVTRVGTVGARYFV